MREIATVPAGILSVFGDELPDASWPGNSFDTSTLAVHLADRLLNQLQLDHRGVAEALSGHLRARLGVLNRDLEEIRNSGPQIEKWAVLQLVQQAPRELEDFDADAPNDFWTRPLPVTEEVLEAWAERVESIRETFPAHKALKLFAEIEQPLEVIEEPVGRFIEDLDRQLQQRIDELRGK